MTYKVARSTCTSCHLIKPRTMMSQRTIEVAANKPRASINPSKGFSSTREYVSSKREKKIWVCNSCLAAQRERDMKSAEETGTVMMAILWLIMGGLGIGLMKNGEAGFGIAMILSMVFLNWAVYSKNTPYAKRKAAKEDKTQNKINEENRIC